VAGRVSPEQAGQQIFCSRCQTDQMQMLQALSNYLPDEELDDATYLANFEKFRQKKEDAFPQLCEQCYPRVIAQLREANRYARSDHIRRITTRSRQETIPRHRPGYSASKFILRVVGIVWALGLAGQIFWHVAFAMQDTDRELTASNVNRLDLFECIAFYAQRESSYGHCWPILIPWVKSLVWLGLPFFWWHPKFLKYLNRPNSKLIGLKEYVMIECLVLVARSTGLYYLEHSSVLNLGSEVKRAVHIALAFLITVVSIWRI
jgi:hypothetical protein